MSTLEREVLAAREELAALHAQLHAAEQTAAAEAARALSLQEQLGSAQQVIPFQHGLYWLWLGHVPGEECMYSSVWKKQL